MTDPDSPELRAVGRPWRAAGTGLVIIAAIVLVVAKALGRDLRSPPMVAGFALLALGWIAAFVGVWLRARRARRPKAPT